MTSERVIAGRNESTAVGELVYQERYSGKNGADEWTTISPERYRALAAQPLTERRVLRVVEHD